MFPNGKRIAGRRRRDKQTAGSAAGTGEQKKTGAGVEPISRSPTQTVAGFVTIPAVLILFCGEMGRLLATV
jgi:hypothetical protein